MPTVTPWRNELQHIPSWRNWKLRWAACPRMFSQKRNSVTWSGDAPSYVTSCIQGTWFNCNLTLTNSTPADLLEVTKHGTYWEVLSSTNRVACHSHPDSFKLVQPLVIDQIVGNAYQGLVEESCPSRILGESPVVQIIMGGVNIHCLLDNGSQVTMVQCSSKKTLDSGVWSWGTSSWLSLHAVNSLSIPCLGYIELNLEVAGVKLVKGVIIVEDTCLLVAPCLLGINVIREVCSVLFQWPKSQGTNIPGKYWG